MQVLHFLIVAALLMTLSGIFSQVLLPNRQAASAASIVLAAPAITLFLFQPGIVNRDGVVINMCFMFLGGMAMGFIGRKWYEIRRRTRR